MAITQSGSSGTGRITCSNESNLTLSQIASAVSGMTALGNGAYHLDRDIEFLNCDFTMLRETLVITADISDGAEYGNSNGRRPAGFVRDDSTVSLQDSVISFDVEQGGLAFVPWFGNSQSGFETGQFTADGCIFFLGDNPARDAGAFLRMQNPAAVFSFLNNQFIGGDPIRGWGSIDGDPSSQMRGNRSFGSGVANIPNSPAEDNFAQDAEIYMQYNTSFGVDSRIIRPAGGNFAAGTIQLLIRRDGEYTCTILDCDLPRTYQNFNPPNNSARRANLHWRYTHAAVVTDDLDGLPEPGVRLDIVPTLTTGPSAQTTKFSDANGAFTETEVIHSRDFFQGNNVETNTQYGPFRLRYAKYGFIFQDRSGDAYDTVRVAEAPRLLRDASVVEPSEAGVSGYTTLNNLDEYRDRRHFERLADLDLADTGAGGGAVTTNGYDHVIDAGASSAFQEAGGTITVRPSATLAPGAVYSALVVDAGDTLTLETDTSVAITANGDVSTATVANITGTLALAGTLTVTGAGGGSLPAGTASSTGRIVVASAAADDTFSGTAMVFDAASVIENTSGQPIIVELGAGQVQPTKVETSGTITFQTPSVTPTFTITGLVADSEVRIYQAGTANELSGVESSGGTFPYTYTWTADFDVDIVVHKEDYEYLRINGVTLGQFDASQPVQQRFDRNYSNPA